MTTACVPNIGPEQRRRRLRGGLISLGLTAAIAVVLLANDAPRLLRLVVFLPACAAGIGLFQAQAKTCVSLAARGTRHMDEGERRIVDAGELHAVRAQSRGVYLKTLVAAIVVTLLVMAL